MDDATTTMTLWHALECPFSMRARLVLREKGQPYESREVALDDVGDEVRERNPKGSVPVLEHGGCTIYEAEIIAEYLEDRFPDPPLYPRDPAGRARARMLLDWIDAELLEPMRRLEQAHVDDGLVGEPTGDAELQDALEQVHAGLRTLGEQLPHGDGDDDGRDGFVLGDYGIVDVFLAPLVVGAPHFGVRRDEMPPAVAQWIDRLRDRPTVAAEARRRLEAMGVAEEQASPGSAGARRSRG